MSSPQSVLLLAGVLVGAALTAWDVAHPPRPTPATLPGATYAARVNDVSIPRRDYERALAALNRDSRNELSAEDRAHVLERLIEQELLLQRATELGLARSDGQVRNALVAALVTSIVQEATEESAQPDEATLRQHFAAHRDYFRIPTLVQVEQLFFAITNAGSEAEARRRAHEAHEAWLAGTPFGELTAQADEPPVQLPASLVPPSKLLDYLGATATRAARELGPSEVSKPVRSGGGYLILRVVNRQGGEVPRFEEARPRVLADYRRRAGERRLREYLSNLKRRAHIERRLDSPR